MLRRNGIVGSLALAAALSGPTPARAQCQYWTPGFEPNGIDIEVGAMTVFAGGASNRALYAAGHDRVAWWDADNAMWNTIGQPNGDCTAMVAFDDGSGRTLYLGGWFDQLDGSPNLVHYIAKWEGAGWSEVGGGTEFFVFALAVFDDGSGGGPALYAAGEFSTAGGVTVHGIAKWDGVNWSALGNGLMQNGSTGDLRALAVFDDGLGGGPALYAAGSFNDASGVPVSDIAKWNGSTWSSLGSGIAGSANIVLALAVHDDGTGGGPALYAGGNFTTAGGAGANSVAKWDGSTWSALGSGIASGVVRSLASYDDGSGGGAKLYAGGGFDSAGGVLSPQIARWDGASWSKVGRGTNGGVVALTVLDDGSGPDLYVGGPGITRAGNLVANHIARWDGSQWSALGGQGLGPFYPEVRAMKAFDDGSGGGTELYVGGTFTSAGSLQVQNVAKWNGTSWSAAGGPIDGPVRALEVSDDGAGAGSKLYACGFFSSAGGVGASNIAAWDGAAWSPLGAGVDSAAFALAVFDDRSGGGPALYAGGVFTTAGGNLVNHVAKWDGTGWTALGSGTDGVVRALAAYDDGLGGGPMLCIGGDFDHAGGVSANRMARWDGATWRPLGSGLPASLSKVDALAVFDDGSGSGPALYAGGETFPSSGYSGVAKWNGTAWTPVCSSMLGDVYTLAIFDDGSGRGSALYAGGNFSQVDGVSAGRIARFDGSTWAALGYSALDNPVTALAVFATGSGASPDLYAGGFFSNADSHPAAGIARWANCSPPGHPGVPVCLGDGSVVPCPCGNDGAAGHGCENSHATGGAQIATAGWTSLAHDTLVLTCSGEGSNVLSIFLEGGNPGAPHAFGDGLLCATAPLVRLYKKTANGGTVSAPQAGDASVSSRSAAVGAPLSSGVSRSYQVYYRDANLSFCPSPPGDAWNTSSGVRIGWTP